MRTKITKAPCKRRTDEAVLRTEKSSMTWLQQIKKFSNVNLERIIETLSWHKILSFNGFSLICVKQKKLRKRRKSTFGNFSSDQKNQRSFTLTILWNLQNPVKTYHGIIGRRHFIDPRRTSLLNELCEEWKKEHQLHCYSQDWMRDDGQILWNTTAICGTSKTSRRTEKKKLPMKDDLENHSKDRSSLLDNVRISFDFTKRSSKTSSFGKNVLRCSWEQNDIRPSIS